MQKSMRNDATHLAVALADGLADLAVACPPRRSAGPTEIPGLEWSFFASAASMAHYSPRSSFHELDINTPTPRDQPAVKESRTASMAVRPFAPSPLPEPCSSAMVRS